MKKHAPGCPSPRGIRLRILVISLMFLVLCASITLYTSSGHSALDEMQQFNAAAGIAAMGTTIMLCLILFMDRLPRDRSTFLFFLLLLSIFLGLLSDNFSWLFDHDPSRRSLNYIASTLSYLIPPLMMPIFWSYQFCLFSAGRKRRPISVVFVVTLSVLDMVLICLGAITGKLFSITEDGTFHSGSLEWMSILFPTVMMILCFADNFHLSMSLRKRVSLLSFCLLPLLGGVVGFFCTQYSFLYIILLLTLILIYGTVQMERSIEVAKQAQALVEKQNQLTLAQIQPRFLETTLSSISELCDRDVALAQRTIGTFSAYLRANMESLQSAEPIPFSKELAQADAYLQIEQLRMGDRLKVRYDIGCTDFELPPLMLQPLLENAIARGIDPKPEGGTITICSKQEGNRITVTVTDDGLHFDVNERLNDEQIRMEFENDQARIRRLFNGFITFESDRVRGNIVTLCMDRN